MVIAGVSTTVKLALYARFMDSTDFFFQLAEILSLSINSLQGKSKDALINIVSNLAYQLINKTTKNYLYLVLCWQTVKPQINNCCVKI